MEIPDMLMYFFPFAEKLETEFARHPNLGLLIAACAAITKNACVVKASSCHVQCRLFWVSLVKKKKAGLRVYKPT